MVLNVRYGPPNHMIRPFKNWTKKCLNIQMFGIQMVTVYNFLFLFSYLSLCVIQQLGKKKETCLLNNSNSRGDDFCYLIDII